MDNYEKSRDRAQEYFLLFDQEKMIDTWKLTHDEKALYLCFLGRDYTVCRRTGEVFRSEDGERADYSESLSIFDLLCHAGERKCPGDRFAPVNSLDGSPKTGGVATEFHQHIAQRFDRQPNTLKLACLELGGREVPMGDIGFQFPLFADLSVILKFYRSDEEFPASITLLWNQNLLDYVYYETVFYIAGVLLNNINGAFTNNIDFAFANNANCVYERLVESSTER